MQTRRVVSFVVLPFLTVMAGIAMAGPGTGMGSGM